MSAGRIVAGRMVRLACERHIKDLEEGAKRGLRWVPELAERAFRFFECLRLADGEHAGQPFMLEPFQKFIVGSIFGWVGLDGFRRFRNAYVEIGKGNGKTPLAAAIGLYCLMADNEPGAEVYAAAVSRDQARICFRDAERFVAANPALRARIVSGVSNLACPATSSFMRAVSSEGRTLDGLRVSCALIDEIHEHPNSDVVDKIRAGTKGRRQALIFEITNSGYDRESVCWQHHEFSSRVLERAIDNDSWFAYIAALDEGDDPLADEACWVKANPNLGVSITEKYLREQVAEAREIPGKRNIVLRLNFCQWTEASTRWLPMEKWRACGREQINLEALQGRECWGGLDLSTTTDITALGWVFPPRSDTERWHLLVRCWVPEEKLYARERRDAAPYRRWVQDGWLEATPGNVIDYEWIRARIAADAERFLVKEIAFDRFNASQIVTQLMADGFQMVPFGQGYVSMNAPSKELEKLVAAERLEHYGNPVLAWMAANVAAAQDPAGNIKPDKARSGDRIDGIVAAVMAIGRAILGGGEQQSVYETRGVFTL